MSESKLRVPINWSAISIVLGLTFSGFAAFYTMRHDVDSLKERVERLENDTRVLDILCDHPDFSQRRACKR